MWALGFAGAPANPSARGGRWPAAGARRRRMARVLNGNGRGGGGGLRVLDGHGWGRGGGSRRGEEEGSRGPWARDPSRVNFVHLLNENSDQSHVE